MESTPLACPLFGTCNLDFPHFLEENRHLRAGTRLSPVHGRSVCIHPSAVDGISPMSHQEPVRCPASSPSPPVRRLRDRVRW